MSLNSALQAGVSGLVANSTSLSTIAANIANVNTTGFKQSQTDFESLVTNSGSSADSSGGVAATTRQLIDQQGQPIHTTSPLDLAISGQGFFVTTSQATNITPTDPRFFTRAGSFTVDNGFLVNADGLVLQGWLADTNGVITTNPSNINSLQSINVSQVGGAVEPTTTVGINGNLDSGQPVSAAATAAAASPPAAGAYNPTTNSMAMFDGNPATGVKPDFSIQVPISDSLGGQHTVQLDLLKSATPDQWLAELVAVPPSDVVDGAGLTNGQIATGVVAFTPTGQIDLTNTTLFNAAKPSITFGASGAAPGAGQVSWATALGVAAQTVTLNLGGAAGSTNGLTQLASQSLTQSIVTNGTAFGNLDHVQVDASGIVTAIFSNGVTRPIAQVAIATFPNPDGLTATNRDAFQVSQDSGTFTLEQPGTGGAGQIDPSTLESSTVDLSSQLTDLITSQSAYSASSKIITTANQMMQALLNIIQ